MPESPKKLGFPLETKLPSGRTAVIKDREAALAYSSREKKAWDRRNTSLAEYDVGQKILARAAYGIDLIRLVINQKLQTEQELQRQIGALIAIFAAYSREFFPSSDDPILSNVDHLLHKHTGSPTPSSNDISGAVFTSVVDELNKIGQKLDKATGPISIPAFGDFPGTDSMGRLIEGKSTGPSPKGGTGQGSLLRTVDPSNGTVESQDFEKVMIDQTAETRAAIKEAHAVIEKLKNMAASSQVVLEELRSGYNASNGAAKEATDVTERMEKLSESFTGMVEQINEAADKAASQAADRVTSQRILEKPAEYWNLKSVDHNTLKGEAFERFWQFSVAAGLAIPAVTFLIFFVASDQLKLSEWATFFALIGAPGLLAVWIIRLKAKEYLSHEALKTDADERVTMMNVYLSLIAQGNIPDEDRHLMLRALFRPANTALTEDPMPGWLGAVVDQIPKPKNPGT